MPRPILLFVVNVDWFFVSHRLRLAEQAMRRGFDVHVCAGDTGQRQRIEESGFTFHELPISRGGTNPIRDFRTLLTLFRLYGRLRPDLVHHVTIKPVLYGGLAAKIRGIPSVHAVSGLGYVFIENSSESIAKKLLRAVLKRTYREALSSSKCHVIFQNPSDRDEFVEGGLVQSSATSIVPGSGVSLEKFAFTPLPEGDPAVVLPARLLKDKGVYEFVEASSIVRRTYPEARFVLAGRLDPDNPAACSPDSVRRWVSEGKVEWLDDVPAAEMPKLYASATLVVLPSYREGLPLVLVEAAAVGRAAVTSDVPGCRDAIREGKTGWLVPARDAERLAGAILEALGDRRELERRSAEARALAESVFAEDSIIGAILRIYERLLGTNYPSETNF